MSRCNTYINKIEIEYKQFVDLVFIFGVRWPELTVQRIEKLYEC